MLSHGATLDSTSIALGPQAHPPLPTTARGLSPLDNALKIYIVKQKIRIPFQTPIRTRSHFKVYNERGEHIFTMGQADPKFKEKFSLMELFTTGGQLIFKIVQRWEEPLKSNDADLEEILPYYRKDQILPTIVYRNNGGIFKIPGKNEQLVAYESKLDNPDSQVHVRHVDGTFLGHIWRGKDCWIIHDANILPKFTFPWAMSRDRCLRYRQHSGNDRHILGHLGRRNSYSCYEYYHSHGFNLEFTEEPLGVVQTEINLPPPFPPTKPMNCSSADFHPSLSQVEKALVMAFVLHLVCHTHLIYGSFSKYCRESTSAERVGRTCMWLCIFLSLMFCLALIAGTLAGMCVAVLKPKCGKMTAFIF